MTGIERLRRLARSQNMDNAWTAMLAHELCDIADQIERERECDADTIENIRLELGEARDEAAWVREHGGLDAVKRRWECLSYYADPVPRSCMEKRLARLQRQIDESHAALRRRREVISELNRRATDLTRECAERGETIRELGGKAAKQSDEIRVMRDAIAETCARLGVEGTGSTVDDAQVIWREISRRLMPEGLSWPVFEDGEPVRPVDRLLDKGGDWFEAVSFIFTCDWWGIRGYQTEGFGDLNDETRRKLGGMAYGSCVKRPAPKVLDADGVEIYKGRIAYGTRGRKYRVTELCEYEPSIVHAQAIDDGELGDEFIAANTGLNSYQLDASKLTHERPESWERLEEDAGKDPCDYFGFDGEETCGKCPASGKNCEQTMARDLVRRARALAERERGE